MSKTANPPDLPGIFAKIADGTWNCAGKLRFYIACTLDLDFDELAEVDEVLQKCRELGAADIVSVEPIIEDGSKK